MHDDVRWACPGCGTEIMCAWGGPLLSWEKLVSDHQAQCDALALLNGEPFGNPEDAAR